MLSQLPAPTCARVVRAALAVAAADGTLTDREVGSCLAHAALMGAREDALEACLKKGVRDARPEDVVDTTSRPFARAILYLGFRSGAADGWDPREREAGQGVASRLGVEASFLDALWGLYRVEHALRGTRLQFLWRGAPAAEEDDDADTTSLGTFGRYAVDAHARRQRYGLGAPLDPALLARMGRIVRVVAAGDGQLAPEEARRLASLYAALGASLGDAEALARDVETPSPPIAELMDKGMRPFARLILYDALSVAGADAVQRGERDVARVAAAHLGLAPSLVAQAEGLVLMEAGVEAARQRLLAPWV